jgi:DNA-binding response OmpR family regulator
MSSILVYEEDDLMRALIHEWLREAGYRVRALPVRDAQPREAADLVIASISSPRNGGAQRVREIKMMHPDTPLIALSGQFRSGLSAAGATAAALGAQQVIAKPLSRGALLEAVRAIIGPSH